MPMHTVRTGRLDVLHGVINRHASGHRATGAVDVQGNFLLRIFHFREQQLRHHQIGQVIINLATQENDSILEQAGIDVEERSPRFVCSMTIGTNVMLHASFGMSAWADGTSSRKPGRFGKSKDAPLLYPMPRARISCSLGKGKICCAPLPVSWFPGYGQFTRRRQLFPRPPLPSFLPPCSPASSGQRPSGSRRCHADSRAARR